MLRIVLNENDGGQRLDKFLSKTVRDLPTPLMYKYIRTKRIKVNGKKAKQDMKLCGGDIIEMYIPEEFTSKKETAAADKYDNVREIPRVVYEDENIIICDKRPGLLSHTGDSTENNSSQLSERDTLIFQIQAYLYKKGEYSPDSEASFAPALCNRIDRNTGGLVIAAKNAMALREINRLIREDGVKKQYLCAVHGSPSPAKATLKGHLFKNSKTKTVTVYSEARRGSKEIITHYKTLSHNKEHNLSLLEVTLGTGRTHQIRAHMASIGHPLLGEGKYGENKNDKKLGFKHQALYSYKVTFTVPDGELDYLNGKVFEAEKQNIKFLELFRSGVL